MIALFSELLPYKQDCCSLYPTSGILVLGLYRAAFLKYQLMSTVYSSLLCKLKSQRDLEGGESLPVSRNKDPFLSSETGFCMALYGRLKRPLRKSGARNQVKVGVHNGSGFKSNLVSEAHQCTPSSSGLQAPILTSAYTSAHVMPGMLPKCENEPLEHNTVGRCFRVTGSFTAQLCMTQGPKMLNRALLYKYCLFHLQINRPRGAKYISCAQVDMDQCQAPKPTISPCTILPFRSDV